MNSMKTKHDKISLLTITLILLGISMVVLIVIGFAASGKTIVATVDSRWWVWTRAVKYERCHTEPSYDSEGNFDGMKEKCTTYVRCSNSRSGTELPPKPPSLSCTPRGSDWVSDSVGYRVSFHREGEEEEHRGFSASAWENLEPGRVVSMTTGLFGHIVEAEIVK